MGRDVCDEVSGRTVIVISRGSQNSVLTKDEGDSRGRPTATTATYIG